MSGTYLGDGARSFVELCSMGISESRMHKVQMVGYQKCLLKIECEIIQSTQAGNTINEQVLFLTVI